MSLSISLPNGFTNVTTAGTAVPLLARTDINKLVKGVATVLLTARKNKTTANTGDVYIGNKGAQSQVLSPGQSLAIDVRAGEELSLPDIFLDAATNGDGVIYLIKKS
ncbi:MAG: hypothetical protein ABJF10_24530 [Chthoniobacter sp.]|uniref:hypothetical protein n=1 Tax=Chthoniobacter sp. TaxID=2510640 RepID=UPI0032A6DECB